MPAAPYRFSVPVQVRMSDLDPFAHVNNGAQCNLFDFGRSCYFEHVFRKPIDWLSMDLVLVHTEFDFKKSIGIHDRLVCDTQVVAVGNSSVSMRQQLRDTATGTVKTTCRSVLAAIDRRHGVTAPIDDNCRKVFTDFESLADGQQSGNC